MGFHTSHSANSLVHKLFIYLSKNLHLLNTLSSQVFYILESSNEEDKRFQTNHLIRRAEVNNRITFS